MPFTMTVGKKDVEIKFNYGLVFKLNKALETEKGAANGAGFAYSQLMDGDESALVDILKVIAGNASEDTILEAIESKATLLNPEDEADGMDQLLSQMIEEIEGSGFFLRVLRIFKKRIQKQITQFPEKSREFQSLQAILETLTNVN